ncbi:MAG: tetratricopeptide repeat protein [Cyanobacteria bacterium P01_C01_bin.118]
MNLRFLVGFLATFGFFSFFSIPSLAQTDAVLLQVDGSLEPGDTQLENGRLYDEYPLQTEAERPVLITLDSEAFDTLLFLLNSDEVIATNDDFKGTTNSQLAIVLPGPGSYRVVATSFNSAQQGSYSLTVKAVSADTPEILASEADQLNTAGNSLLNQANYLEALELFQQSLAIRQDIDERYGIAESLNNIGFVYDSRGDYAQALDYYQQALAIRQELGDRQGESVVLSNIGTIYSSWDDYAQALDYYQQALAIRQELGDRQGESIVFNNMGFAYEKLAEYSQALDYYQQALAIYKELDNRRDTASTLNNIGSIYSNRGEHLQALDYYQEALAISQEFGDRSSVGSLLNNIGFIYNIQSNHSQALDYYQQSLAIRQEIADRRGEGEVLSNIGFVFSNQGDYPQALDYYLQSLAIRQEIGNRRGTGEALSNIGGIYFSQGDYPQALDYYQQSLAIRQEIGDRRGIGEVFTNIGTVYSRQEDYTEALDYYQQALTIAEDIGDRNNTGSILNNIGSIYDDQANYSQALDYYQRSLAIRQAINDREGESISLNNIAGIYESQNDYQQALDYYQQGLSIAKEIGIPELEARLLANIGEWFQQRERPTLAIVFLKQAINNYERVRTNNRDFSQKLQQSYTETVSGKYRALADLLLEQGRIPEAQQVLDLLQLEELREFTDIRATWTSDGIRLSEPEQTVADAHGSLVALGNKVVECERDNCTDLNRLYQQQESLLEQYNNEVAQFVDAINTNRRDDDVFQNPDNVSGDAQKLLEAYAADEQKALLVYPFVLEDKLWLVWVTVGDVVGSIEVPVSQAELATTVQQFGALLKSRSSDITELQATSQKLYSWIIQPIATELEKNNIDHLVFVNDRVTRYIPMGALHDGENYLLENYTISTVLSPAATNMGESLDSVTDSNVLGLGLTEAVGDFNPLPAVRDELAGIIKGQDGDGIYPGQTFLNQNFTFDAFKNNVQGNRILHVATHAAFEPGRPEESFIVLGDGNRMKIPDIETMQRRLRNLHLVVLSACQTALGGTNQEDGNEIAGLSSYFLEANRAEAVIASLWSVNDSSTSLLMQRFYENLAAGETKADALRKAQLFLLGSNQTADGDARLIGQRQAEDQGTTALSHPYYWAPFILIGNGL